ncbi:MAG: primosomal replication protein N [Sterolibacterium sp.]|nr:primosomal replication protein N [Sterolibacterium sp.]
MPEPRSGQPPDNCTRLTGQLLELNTLRYTPAGIPVLNFRIAHSSQQIEAGRPRTVDCEVSAVILGPNAQLMTGAKPGDAVRLSGFLAAKSLKSRTLILHVNEIEFLEGNQNGI